MDFQLNLNTETVDHSYPSKPLCLPPTATVREAMQHMNDRNEAAVLICVDGVLTGIFTERDALLRMATGASFEVPLADVMTKRPTALTMRDNVGTAISKLSQGGFRRLPIVDDKGLPSGILKMEGILHYLIQHFPAMVYNLPPQPHYSARDSEGA